MLIVFLLLCNERRKFRSHNSGLNIKLLRSIDQFGKCDVSGSFDN